MLAKATSAKNKNEEAEICENIKLAYGEWQIAQHTGTDKTAEEIIEDCLKLSYGDNITNVKVKNEKVTVNMLVNTQAKIYIYKANTGEAYEYVDVIDYKGKTRETLFPGDDISIGTEKFRVFYNKDGLLKAMPWYSLITVTADGTVKQWPAVEGTSTSILTKNAQQYINSYQRTLENQGIEGVRVRACIKSELDSELPSTLTTA